MQPMQINVGSHPELVSLGEGDVQGDTGGVRRHGNVPDAEGGRQEVCA